jgi:hypothetical protein
MYFTCPTMLNLASSAAGGQQQHKNALHLTPCPKPGMCHLVLLYALLYTLFTSVWTELQTAALRL